MARQAEAGFEDCVRSSFARQHIMAMIGAQLVHVAAGEVDVALPYRNDLTQQHGVIHAGVLSTVLDTACGYAGYTLMPADSAILTVEFTMNLLASSNTSVLARGRVLRAGRTITFCEGRAVEAGPDGERLIATMSATLMCVRDRELLG